MKCSKAISIALVVLVLLFFGLYHRIWSYVSDLSVQREVGGLWRRGAFVDGPLPYDVQKVSVGLNRLSSTGFAPKHILDVGANVGDWAKYARAAFSRSLITMIEGSDTCVEPLSATGEEFAIALVGADNTHIDFYEQEQGKGNSIYREKTKNFDNIAPKRKRVFTLDALMRGKPPVDLLKLDVQGAEQDALMGAAHLLRSVEVIVLEVGLIEYNEGAPLALDTLSLLNTMGYDLFDIIGFVVQDTDVHRVVMQVDFIVVRRGSDIFTRKAELSK
jgi:FkbM family methyltransferase